MDGHPRLPYLSVHHLKHGIGKKQVALQELDERASLENCEWQFHGQITAATRRESDRSDFWPKTL